MHLPRETAPPQLPTPTRPSQSGIPGLPNPYRTRPGVIVGSVVGAVVGVFILLFAVFWWRNKGCVARPRARPRVQPENAGRESFETARTHPSRPPTAGEKRTPTSNGYTDGAGLLLPPINTDQAHLAPLSAEMSPRERMLALYANQSRTSLASHTSNVSHVSHASYASRGSRASRASHASGRSRSSADANAEREPLPAPSSPTPFGRRPSAPKSEALVEKGEGGS